MSQVWDLFYNGVAVKTLLTQKIKEESLRTYLFTYSAIYDSLSLITLADMFELQLPVVHAIINKMIINEELMVSEHINTFQHPLDASLCSLLNFDWSVYVF